MPLYTSSCLSSDTAQASPQKLQYYTLITGLPHSSLQTDEIREQTSSNPTAPLPPPQVSVFVSVCFLKPRDSTMTAEQKVSAAVLFIYFVNF